MGRILGAPSDKALNMEPTKEDPFQTISETDLYKADDDLNRELLHYAGYTLLSVVLFLIIFYCAVTDPRAFIIAFGSGCPCCLLCPCISSLAKYTDPAKLIQANVNTYVPGIIVEEGGNLKAYEPSPEEIEALHELVGEFMSVP